MIGTNAAGNAALANYQGVVDPELGQHDRRHPGRGGQRHLGQYLGRRDPEQSANNLVQGNYIGTDVTGSVSVPNGFLSYYYRRRDQRVQQFAIRSAGRPPVPGNVISGNGSDGVDIVGVSDNLLQGNLIGVGANGTEPLGNGAGGVSAFYGASYNTIGGLAAGAGNVIANNQTRPGVNIGASNSRQLPGQRDPLEFDLQQRHARASTSASTRRPTRTCPAARSRARTTSRITRCSPRSDTVTGVGTVVTGTLNSAPARTFTLQFFDNPTADPVRLRRRDRP